MAWRGEFRERGEHLKLERERRKEINKIRERNRGEKWEFMKETPSKYFLW